MPSATTEIALGKIPTLELVFVAEHAAELSRIVAASGTLSPKENTAEAFKQVASKAQVSPTQLRRLVDAFSNLRLIQSRLRLPVVDESAHLSS